MLLQKDEAQQEDLRIRNVYHVIRQREVRLSKDASPTLFVIAAERIHGRCVEMRNEIQKIGKVKWAQNKGDIINNQS